MEKGKPWTAACFGGYCAMMLWLLLCRSGSGGEAAYWEAVKGHLNLVPFRTIARYIRLLGWTENRYLRIHALVNLAGNVVLFLPMGCFLPALFSRLRKLWKTLLWTALAVGAVEGMQLFLTVGSCDIDDLILNTAGAALGYLAWWLFRGRMKKG